VVRDPVGAPVLFWLDGALGDTLLAYPALAALWLSAAGRPVVVVGNPAYYALAIRPRLIDRAIDASGAAGAALFGGALPPGLPLPETAVLFSGAHLALAGRLRALGVAQVISALARGPGTRHQSAYLLDCLDPLTPFEAASTSLPDSVSDAPEATDREIHPPGQPYRASLDMQQMLDAAANGTAPHSIPVRATRVGSGSRLSVLTRPLAPALRTLLGPADRPTVLLHPGAGGHWKRWPPRHFLSLAGRLARAGCAVRWSCGPADDDLRTALLAEPERPGELWPDLQLDDYAALLARCALLVSADTGVAHLAALLDVPQVALFGPTDPLRWGPLADRAAVIRSPDRCEGRWEALAAAPDEPTGEPRLALQRCYPFDRAACRCLAALPVEEVLAACLPRLR